MDPKAQYTVLRIKRKATEPPLSSLVIQDPSASDRDPSGRVKKRRDVSGRPRGVFRLAETVPPTWQGQGDEGEALKTRIKGLMETMDLEEEEEGMNAPVPLPASASTFTSAFDSGPEAGPSRVPPPGRDGIMSPTKPATQYRVIPPISPRSRMMLPPKVYSHKDVASGRLVFVDAAAVEAAQARAEEEAGKNRSILPEAPEEEDKEMAAFQSMLKEYLSLEQPTIPRSEARLSDVEEAGPSRGLDDGYVYDLYYRDARPPARLNMGVGDGITQASIGALLGYEDFSPPSTPSDSEIEDEADEDSNDEDFYRNDYPEDEDADSDMEDLGNRDGLWSEDEDDEGGEGGSDEERGNWDYR